MTTQKQISTALVAALKPLVGDRVGARRFPLYSGNPIWPAIRYSFISAAITEDVCGDGGEEVADYRLQVDVGDEDKRGEASFLDLCSQVLATVSALGPQYRWAGQSDFYDEDLKVNMRSLDFIVYLSS